MTGPFNVMYGSLEEIWHTSHATKYVVATVPSSIESGTHSMFNLCVFFRHFLITGVKADI